jgi:3-deoxy-D-manno-octulosonic-acid transferase
VQAPQASPLIQQLHAAIPPGTPVLVCGSTVEGEEKMLLGAFEEVRREFPNALMILAPRHPERFDEVAALTQGLANAPQGASGGYKFWRRSRIDPAATLSGGVLLLDSIGELAAVYSLATVALVGGSLAPRGGHNILEPARFAKAIIVGPHTENFRDVIAIFRQASAVRELRSGTNLESTLSEIFLHLLRHSEEREELGGRAAAVVEQQNGATERCVRTLAALVTDQPTAAEQPMAEARR